MKTSKKYTGNMTSGSPLRIILLFSLPILLGCIFQQLYNVADTAVVGHTLGDQSLAAIGATSSVYILIINFANGFMNGFSVIIAKYFGAGNESKMRNAVSLSVLLSAAIAVLLTAAGLIGINPLLRLLGTPDDIFAESSRYLTIIIAFLCVTIFYNMLAGMLRAVGNSLVPLIALITATCINIALDIVFIRFFHMGVAGAAYATVIAQMISAVICLVYIYIKCPLLRFSPKLLRFDGLLLGELLTTGISMALMLAVVDIGSVILQGGVNSFGSATITAHTAGRRIDYMLMMPLSSIGAAAATFVSQNYGAGRFDRVTKGIKISVIITYVWNAAVLILCSLFGRAAITALTGTSDTEIIATAFQYLIINVPFFFILSILLILRSCLQSIGKKTVPLIASVIEMISKLLAVRFLVPALGYLGICILEPIIWFVCAIMVLIDFCFAIRKLKNTSPLSAESALTEKGQ